MCGFSDTSDEELFLAAHFGNQMARGELESRYYLIKKTNIVRTVPGILSFCTLDELVPLGIQVYSKCYALYKPGKARFRSYYEAALQRSLWRYQNDKIQKEFGPFSFDDIIPNTGVMTLHDVLPANSIKDNPRIYVDYLEEAASLGVGSKAITDDVLAVASLRIDGMTFSELSKKLGITPRMAYRRFRKYRDVVKGLIQRPTHRASKSQWRRHLEEPVRPVDEC